MAPLTRIRSYTAYKVTNYFEKNLYFNEATIIKLPLVNAY